MAAASLLRVVAPECCFLEGAVHSLDLAVRPWMLWFGEAVLDAMFATDPVKQMQPVTCCWTIPS
jgi:hypothetical protein